MRHTLSSAALAVSLFALATHGVLAKQALITIDVQNADLSDVVALLSAEAGVNIVMDASVKPERVTLHLRNVRFRDALGVLVLAHGLQVRREHGVLIIGEADIMNRRYADSSAALSARTVVVGLRHAKSIDIAKEIQGALPSGTVIVPDERTSSIVVTGDADTVRRARSLIGALDVPSPRRNDGDGVTHRFLLRFVKADDVVKQLKVIAPTGIYVADAQQNAVLVSGGERIANAAQSLIRSVDIASPQVLFEVKVADITPLNDQSNFGLEFGGATLEGQAFAGGTAYAFKGGSIPLNVTLNALITQGRAQILATPRLVTLNNREADLLIGQTYPIVFNTSVLGGQNVQFVDIGVKLRLTPTIGPDGMVTAELHPEYSELLGFTDTGYPIIANRKIDSTLRIANDQTIVLGGLMRDVSSQTIARVPGLSNIPVLGNFFKNKQTRHERDEIVFLITPHVIFPNGPTPQK